MIVFTIIVYEFLCIINELLGLTNKNFWRIIIIRYAQYRSNTWEINIIIYHVRIPVFSGRFTLSYYIFSQKECHYSGGRDMLN